MTGSRGSRFSLFFPIGVRFELFIVCALLFYVFIWPDAPYLERTGDGPSYLETACDLSDGRLDALHDRPPGYPILLSLLRICDEPGRALYIAQILLHFFSVAAMAVVLGMVIGFGRAVWVFVLLASLPPAVASAAYVRSETMSAFTLTLTVAGLVFWLRSGHWKWLIAATLLAAFAALVRPAYQLLGVALAAVLISMVRFVPDLAERLRRAAGIVLVVPLAVVLAFSLFNHARFGYFGVTPLFGFNLSNKTVRVVERLPDEYATIREILIQHRDQTLVARGDDHSGHMYIWPARAALQRATGLGPAQLSKQMLKVNLVLIRQAPLHYLGEVVSAIPAFWMPSQEIAANFGSRGVQLMWAALDLVLSSIHIALALALVGVLLVYARVPAVRNGLPVTNKMPFVVLFLALGVILYTALVSSVVETGIPRYREPVNLLVLLSTIIMWNLQRSLPARS